DTTRQQHDRRPGDHMHRFHLMLSLWFCSWGDCIARLRRGRYLPPCAASIRDVRVVALRIVAVVPILLRWRARGLDRRLRRGARRGSIVGRIGRIIVWVGITPVVRGVPTPPGITEPEAKPEAEPVEIVPVVIVEAPVKIAVCPTALDMALTGSTAGRRCVGWDCESQGAERRRQHGRELEPL